jgi:anti-sigma factor RsiW
MDCIEPGAVSPEGLIAFADGEADARTAAHVAACGACAARAAAYVQDQRWLSSWLYRVDCPPAQTLGELSLGLLAPDDALGIRTHLALCPHCRGELAGLDAALRDDPLAVLTDQTGRLARIVARLLPAPASGLAYTGVRGAAASAARIYEAEGVTLSLAVEVEEPERSWTLLGLVVDESGAGLPAGAPVRLLREDRIAAEAALDEVGNVVFAGLEAGRYELDVTLGERAIVVEGIEVGAPPG